MLPIMLNALCLPKTENRFTAVCRETKVQLTAFVIAAFSMMIVGCGSSETPTPVAAKAPDEIKPLGLYREDELASRYGRVMVETKSEVCTEPESAFADKKISYEHEASSVQVWIRGKKVVKERFINVRNGISANEISNIREINSANSGWKLGFDGSEPIWKRKDGAAVMWPEKLDTGVGTPYIASVTVITPLALQAHIATGQFISEDKEKAAWLKQNVASLSVPE